MIEIRIAVSLVCMKSGGWLSTRKDPEGTCWGTGNVLYLDLDNADVCVCFCVCHSHQDISIRCLYLIVSYTSILK